MLRIMTPTDHMSTLQSHSIPRMTSGARYTPGMTFPVYLAPILAAPKSHIIGSPMVKGMAQER